MSSSGINIKGRSRKLYLNYRTTEEIRRVGVAMLEGCEVDDLDDGLDEVKRYKSLSHGPMPAKLEFQHLENALENLILILSDSIDKERSICVIVPTNNDAKVVYDFLKSRNILVITLGPNDVDQSDSKSVRVATMHRAKGLEFDEVVLFTPKNWGAIQVNIDNIKRLQYVAITRAKKIATIIKY